MIDGRATCESESIFAQKRRVAAVDQAPATERDATPAAQSCYEFMLLPQDVLENDDLGIEFYTLKIMLWFPTGVVTMLTRGI